MEFSEDERDDDSDFNDVAERHGDFDDIEDRDLDFDSDSDDCLERDSDYVLGESFMIPKSQSMMVPDFLENPLNDMNDEDPDAYSRIEEDS